MREHHTPGQSGFSLIEVIVATVISVIAILGLAHSFGIGRALIDRFEAERGALAVVQGRLEMLTKLPSSSPELTIGDHTGPLPIEIAPGLKVDEKWKVEGVDDPADNAGGDTNPLDYRRVTVSMSWKHGSFPEKIELSRIFLNFMNALTRTNQRGFTLAEAMVVIVLSGVVTIGLLGFYLNSQATWIDGSSQAMTQREGTLLVETMAERVREASSFTVQPASAQDPTHSSVWLFDSGGASIGSFEWEGMDSRVHYFDADHIDRGPVTTSVVQEFQLADDVAAGKVLHLTKLRLISSGGSHVDMSSMFALQNAP